MSAHLQYQAADLLCGEGLDPPRPATASPH